MEKAVGKTSRSQETLFLNPVYLCITNKHMGGVHVNEGIIQGRGGIIV